MRRKVKRSTGAAVTRDSQLIRCNNTDSEFLKSLQVNLSRLIAYAESADIGLQREVCLIHWSPSVNHIKRHVWYLSETGG